MAWSLVRAARRESGLSGRARDSKWFLRTVVSSIAAAVVAIGAVGSAPVPVADAAPTMCGKVLAPRPHTVFLDTGDPAVTGMTYADGLAGLERWNALFRKYHGFDIFVPFTGNWWEADVLVTSAGTPATWVHTGCDASYAQRGNNQSIVFIGKNDASRNAVWFAHEMGHVLGIADFTPNPLPGHINAQPCGNYIGVMSYCSGQSSWFVDAEAPGFVFDGQMVRDYWR